MTEDWINTTAGKEWAEAVLSDMKPKLKGSALVMQLVPDDGIGDAKFWVELGASIMMEKPIVAVVMSGRKIPEKLKMVADEVVYLDEGVNGPESGERLEAAMDRVMGENNG